MQWGAASSRAQQRPEVAVEAIVREATATCSHTLFDDRRYGPTRSSTCLGIGEELMIALVQQ
jgi:hypothetical protein